jgi:hypothetical protein
VEFVVAHEIYAGYFLDDSIVCRMIVSNLTAPPRKESLCSTLVIQVRVFQVLESIIAQNLVLRTGWQGRLVA